MKKKSIPELDKLFFEIETYRESSHLKELFEFVRRFPYIAPYNAMLIHIQKPGSNYVASATKWRDKFNRTIKPGARPLVILRPFGPVSFVFELSDTEGYQPFPEELLNPFKVEGQIPNEKFINLKTNLINDGISYSEAEHGTSSAGFIQTTDSTKRIKIYKGQKEIILKVVYNLVVNKNHSKETKFATILHELGHIYCGHLGTPNSKWWDSRCHLNINQEEFEAECVCWLICERLGIGNPSAKYLSGYLDNNREIPQISIDTVLKSVGIIESMINGIKKPRKEIIIQKK